MFLTEVISLLRQKCPIFESRVSGSQAFVATQAPQNQVEAPACFIVPMSDTAAAPTALGYTQQVTERFATIVLINNALDKSSGRGMGAIGQLDTAKAQLFAALLQYQSTIYPMANGVIFARSQHLFMNSDRLWHQFEWTMTHPITGTPNGAYIDNLVALLADGYPDVEPDVIKQVFVQGSPTVNSFPEPSPSSTASYNQIMEILGVSPPTWIKRKPLDNPNYPEPGGQGELFADPSSVKKYP